MTITPPSLGTDIQSPLWRQAILALFSSSVKGKSISPSVVTVGASPFVYVNTQSYSVDVVLSGGVIGALSFKRYINHAAGGAVTIPNATSMIGLSPGDALTVTYSSTPTFTVIPR